MAMLRAWSLPVPMGGAIYYVSSLSGSLVRYSGKPDCRSFAKTLPNRVRSALQLCDEPYECSPPQPLSYYEHAESLRRLKSINERFERIGIGNFFLLRLYAGIATPVFASTAEALGAIQQTGGHDERWNRSCLIRGLLVSKTSQSFRQNGVLFIGAFLPMGEMHAWIIEGNQQPDPRDRSWVNYRPLLALCWT